MYLNLNTWASGLTLSYPLNPTVTQLQRKFTVV